MSRSQRRKVTPHLPAQGLLLQLFAIILLPLTIVLLAVAFGSLNIHNQAMRSLVGERDARAVMAAADALSNQIANRVTFLESATALFAADPAAPVTTTLGSLGYMAPYFDGGIAIFESQGQLLVARGGQPAWDALMADPGWPALFAQLTSQPGKLEVIRPSPSSGSTGLISQPLGAGNLIVGAFSIDQMVSSTLQEVLPADGLLSILLVGANQQILYSSGHLADQSAQHPGVAQALHGESGSLYVKVAGDEHVTAYSPVSSAGWALLTEESWEAVTTPTLKVTQIAPLALVPTVIIMLLAIWFGASQVIRPLRTLGARTATLANGDFETIQKPVGGISEIRQLQQTLVDMAEKVDEAQHSLHSYIGAITEAQEDERRRLARELHDDTLQAMIALKQRVQLAELSRQPSTSESTPESAELAQISQLVEQSIENLRRLTRALRPIYLEDLGLVPALEMLARETGQQAEISVDFQRVGVEQRLSPSAELAFYRIAQEACSNIARHARANKASIQISFDEDKVVLQVKDNGVGFALPASVTEYASGSHFGLLGMHERAELMGAKLDIQSRPAQGTSVVVTLPGVGSLL